VSTTFGLATSILAARLLRLSPALRLALLPRAVTTPLALEMSRLLSADPAIVILTVFTTGLVVVTLGPLILKRLRCTDPVARGIALGATAHGGGVLALAGEKQVKEPMQPRQCMPQQHAAWLHAFSCLFHSLVMPVHIQRRSSHPHHVHIRFSRSLHIHDTFLYPPASAAPHQAFPYP
jgi:hypothetical protein